MFDYELNENYGYELFEESVDTMTALLEAKTPEQQQEVLNKKVEQFKKRAEQLKKVDGREKDKKGLIKYGLALISLLGANVLIVGAPTLSIICSVSAIILSISSTIDIGYKDQQSKYLVQRLQDVKRKAKKKNLDTKQIDVLIEKCAEINKQELKRDKRLIGENSLFLTEEEIHNILNK